MDDKKGIKKKHTSGFNYFFTTFGGSEADHESLNKFLKIFRPEGMNLISLRKALVMDYELG